MFLTCRDETGSDGDVTGNGHPPSRASRQPSCLEGDPHCLSIWAAGKPEEQVKTSLAGYRIPALGWHAKNTGPARLLKEEETKGQIFFGQCGGIYAFLPSRKCEP